MSFQPHAPARPGPAPQCRHHDRVGLRDYAERLAIQHPPLSLGDADLTIRDPDGLRLRYGKVFTYLTRVELEVERNVIELRALLPHATETDRFFFEDVWSPQELQHGVLLDAVQHELGMPSAPVDLGPPGIKLRVAGSLSHLPGVAEILRLLYYLTGAATERSAVVAYSRLVDGLRGTGEDAIAETVIAPIRRQEPGHFAFYRLSAEALIRDEGLSGWQLHLARILRRRSFNLVGVNNLRQRADFGDVARALDLDRDRLETARQMSLVERELLWSKDQGLQVPDYVLRTLDEAISLSETRSLAEGEFPSHDDIQLAPRQLGHRRPASARPGRSVGEDDGGRHARQEPADDLGGGGGEPVVASHQAVEDQAKPGQRRQGR